MSRAKGSNINLVKAHNMSAILYYLLQNQPVSRVELAEKLGLSNTTITNLTAELLEEEIILEKEIKITEKRKRVGRPRRMLALIPDARYAVGVHIGVGMYRVAVTDLFAKIISNQMGEFELDTPAQAVIAEIAAKIRQTVNTTSVDPDRIIGVGIGASGLVNYLTGVNVLAPRLGWKDVPIQSLLAPQVPYPITVDNNVRSMAMGEAYFGAGRKAETLAFVYGRVGVGAGFVVNRQIFRGSRAGAGEIGHTIMEPRDGQPCSCGNSGCLETLVSEPVLIKEAIQLSLTDPSGLLAQHLEKAADQNQMEQIFTAARQGDRNARALVEDRACYLGIALANLVNILNPDLILLGGMFAQGSDLIIPVAEGKMKELAFAGLGDDVKIATTEFGWRAGVVGAASLALTAFFYQQNEGL
jgi:predicted NBD/HSP70 family sugar kinase